MCAALTISCLCTSTFTISIYPSYVLVYPILTYVFLFNLSYLILSHPILSYLIPAYPILSYLIPDYPTVSYLILSYPVLSYLSLSCPILSYLIVYVFYFILSIYRSYPIYLSIVLSTYLSIYLIYLFIFSLSISLSIDLLFYPFIYISI